MARRFFNPEGLIWKPLGWLGDIVMLSLLWGVCSIPLVTVGPATAALYDTTVHCLRRHENDPFSRFFRTFRAELKIGALSTLLWAALLALPVIVYRLAAKALGDSAAGRALAIGYLLVLFFLLAVLVWVFPTLSRFTFGVAALSRTALRLAFGNILRSAAMAVITALGAALSYRLILPVIFLPGLVALLCSLLIEPVFRRYTDGG